MDIVLPMRFGSLAMRFVSCKMPMPDASFAERSRNKFLINSPIETYAIWRNARASRSISFSFRPPVLAAGETRESRPCCDRKSQSGRNKLCTSLFIIARELVPKIQLLPAIPKRMSRVRSRAQHRSAIRHFPSAMFRQAIRMNKTYICFGIASLVILRLVLFRRAFPLVGPAGSLLSTHRAAGGRFF